MTEREWLSVDEVATLFGISKRTIWEMVERDQIPHGRFGTRRIRFNRVELEAWVRASRRSEPPPPAPEPIPRELPRGRRGPKPGRGSRADLFS